MGRVCKGWVSVKCSLNLEESVAGGVYQPESGVEHPGALEVLALNGHTQVVAHRIAHGRHPLL